MDVEIDRDIEVKNHTHWVMLSIQGRIDAFNYDEMKGALAKALNAGKKQVAINLENTKFLSLSSIKYFSTVAEDLQNQGGCLALLAPSEKIKRQIHVFASLESMHLYRSTKEWEEIEGIKGHT